MMTAFPFSFSNRAFLFLVMLIQQSLLLQAQDNLDLHSRLGQVDSSGIFISADYYTWGASVIRGEDGRYHMFYSRWPHGTRTATDDSLNYIFNGFRGWNKYSEIAYAVADRLTGPYHYVCTVLKGSGDPARWDRFTFHNPLIRKFEGYYYLYYISNSFDSSYTLNRSSSRQELQWLRYNCSQKIGVVRAKTLHDLVSGHFEQSPSWLMAPDGRQTFEVATNPAVTRGPDGQYYMMYKSRMPNAGHMTFWMARSKSPMGPFETIAPVLNTAETACEDPCLWYDWKRKRFYAAAKYFSHSKQLVSQFGALVLLTSKDGLHWQPAGHPLISLRQLRFRSGKTIQLTHLERPFIYTDAKGQARALLAAASVEDPFQDQGSAHNSFNVQIPLAGQ